MVFRLAAIGMLLFVAGASDWSRFRGRNGGGSTETTGLPLRWSSTENIAWKTPLPGFGSSSPIVVGDRAFVTCYSGYGLDRENPGEMDDLRLHFVCLASADGHIVWDRRIRPRLPEREFSGYMVNHGYASASPASDGKAVYAFFGRSGAWAFDLDGKLLWKVSLGENTHEFGTGGSPMVDGDRVIFNATVESGALVALNKATGEEIWRTEKLPASWATPAMLTLPGGGCLRPASGEIVYEQRLLRIYPWASPIVAKDKIYVVGKGRVVVLAVGPVYEELTVNEMADGGRFHATPAVDGSKLLIRSDAFLYCVGR